MTLVEWKEFGPNHFDPVPSRQKARKWVRSGELPGLVIGKDIFVDQDRFNEEKRPTKVPDEVKDMLR